jgi:hypothetical protein
MQFISIERILPKAVDQTCCLVVDAIDVPCWLLYCGVMNAGMLMCRYGDAYAAVGRNKTWFAD